MKETFYFSHDYNARSDEKIIKLLATEGWLGYGIFWALIEKLYEADGFLEKDYNSIAFDLRTQSDRIATVVEGYGLFEVASKKFYSKSVLARLTTRKGKTEQARQAALLRWNKPKKPDADALRTQSDRYASKVKESKVNKSKDINIMQPEAAGIQEIFELFYEINPTINFGNKTQRSATERIIKRLGNEKALASTKAAIAIFGKPYAPTITTPIQLENKLSELVAFYKKQDNSSKAIII